LCTYRDEGDDLDLVEENEGGESGEHVFLKCGRRRQNGVVDILHSESLVNFEEKVCRNFENLLVIGRLTEVFSMIFPIFLLYTWVVLKAPNYIKN
jgi:hypothetical protein